MTYSVCLGLEGFWANRTALLMSPSLSLGRSVGAVGRLHLILLIWGLPSPQCLLFSPQAPHAGLWGELGDFLVTSCLCYLVQGPSHSFYHLEGGYGDWLN